MHPFRDASSVAATILLFSAVSLQTIAAPGADNHRLPALPTHQSARSQPQKLSRVFPQLTWLRDAAIERVFGAPPKAQSERVARPQSSSRLPATLLAQYGGDVVLRFNISTSDEEAALSEAADTLFLDVWEFNNNWADIRLREDDVSTGSGYITRLERS